MINMYLSRLLKSKIAKNGFWMILLQGFNTIIPLLTIPYITRILSKSVYGEFSIALNWIGYLQVLVEYGFGLTGARKAATNSDSNFLGKTHSTIICSRIYLLVLSIIVLGGIIIFSDVDAPQIECMLILFFMVVAVVFQQNWLFQGIAEMQNIAVINVVSRSISVILIFMFVKSPDDLYLYCFLYISNYLVSSLLGCIIVRRRYNVRFQIPQNVEIIDEIKNGWPLFVSLAMTKIFGSFGITVLGFISTKDEVGVYSAINKIPYVLTLLFAAISQTLYPFMCKSFQDSFSNGIKSVKKMAVPIVSVFLAGGIIIIVLRNTIVNVAFSSEYSSGTVLVIPFIVWVLFGIINNFLGVQILVASGHQKEYSTAFTISVCLMIVLMFVLGIEKGSIGVAVASMLSEMILSIILSFYISRIIQKNDVVSATND